MKYFTIEELCRSSVALREGIDNTPSPAGRQCMETLICKLLDPVRERWGRPLTVNSGYRCSQLNARVGGAASSQHLLGEAADITTGSPAGNRQLFELIQQMAGRGEVAFDQLIDERGYSWLHLSYREGRNRGQVLHL